MEFTQLLKRIDPSLTEDDIAQAFWRFDKDDSGTITLKEFSAVLRGPPPKPKSHQQPTQQPP